jgi:hypothetical protein
MPIYQDLPSPTSLTGELFPKDPFNDPFFTPGYTQPKPSMPKTFLYEDKENDDAESVGSGSVGDYSEYDQESVDVDSQIKKGSSRRYDGGGSRSHRDRDFQSRRRLQKGEDFLGVDKESGVVTMRPSRRIKDSSSLLSPRTARRSNLGSQYEEKRSFHSGSPVRIIGKGSHVNRPSRRNSQISPTRRKFRAPEVLMDSDSPVSLSVLVSKCINRR